MSEVEITGVFEDVLGMIYSAKQKAEYQVNSTIIDLYWSIGEYVSKQIDVNGWGKSTVKALSEYILSKEPGIRGYSSQNIWRMKQFYETYKDKPELSKLLRENTWSNNLHIISKTKSYEEKEFYLKLASKEKYKAKELARQIDSGYYERLLLSNGKAPSAIESKDMTGVLRDIDSICVLMGIITGNRLVCQIIRKKLHFLCKRFIDSTLLINSYTIHKMSSL